MRISKARVKRITDKYFSCLLKLQNIYDYDVTVETEELHTLWDFFKQQKGEAILFTDTYFRDIYKYVQGVLKELKAMPNCNSVDLDAYKFLGFLRLVRTVRL